MDRIGVFTHDFQILYLFETRETLEFVLKNSFEGSLYTRRRWWFCCYLYQWYNLWCKTLSDKQSAACYSRFHYTKTRNISKTPVGARWCNFKRLLGTISKLLSSHSKKTLLIKCVRFPDERRLYTAPCGIPTKNGYFSRGLFQNITNVRQARL